MQRSKCHQTRCTGLFDLGCFPAIQLSRLCFSKSGTSRHAYCSEVPGHQQKGMWKAGVIVMDQLHL